MTPNGSLQLFPTTCRIRVPAKVHMPDNPEGHCGWVIRNEPLSIPILGQMPEVRAMKLANALQTHIQRMHHDMWQAIQQGSMKYTALLAGQMFDMADPHAQLLMRALRIECLQPIPRFWISDIAIRDTVEKFGLTDEQRQKVIKAMTEMRSLLTETRPDQPAEEPRASAAM